MTGLAKAESTPNNGPAAKEALAALSPAVASGPLAPAVNGSGRKLTGPEKSLLLMVSLEEAVATRILAQLSNDEVIRLKRASATLTEVEPTTIIAVHREFAETLQRGVPASLAGSSAYLRRLAGKALGEGRVAELWSDRATPKGPVARLAALDLPTILALLEHEKPQTVAILLSQLDPGRAAEIVAGLPAELQAEIVLRMARLSSVPMSVLEEIERQFAAEVDALGESERKTIKGIDAAADLVKRLGAELSETLLDELASMDTLVADSLRKNLFTFEDLLRIDGRGMQQLLKEVATDQLVVALKTASEDLREKIFGNVSSRAAAMLRDELEMLGPVKVSDVEEAQRAVCQVALTLEQEGRIQIAREGGSDYV